MTNVSIVIPSYNRRDLVCSLVAVLIDQCDPRVVTEVIVVLDGSTDGSAEALAKLSPPTDVNLRVHCQSNRGRAATRNAGLSFATGRIVLFLDDDVLPEPGLIMAHVCAHASADVVLGRIEPVSVPGTPPVLADLDAHFYQERHRALSQNGAPIRANDVFAGNLSAKRALLHAVGGFDECFTGYGCEDWDLGQRLLATGAIVAYQGDAIVHHPTNVTPAQWQRHAWQEGRSQLTFVAKHPTLSASLDISDLQQPTWPGRFVAHLSIQFPRFGLVISAAAFRFCALAHWVVSPRFLQRVALQSWRAAFWSGVRAAVGSAGATRAVCRYHAPILCYHRVCDDPNPALADWAVRTHMFQRQMALLRRLGYRAITLDALIDAFEAGRPLDKVIVITFDDGYQDVVTTAAPILDDEGFPATLFVVPGLVGKTAEWDAVFGGTMAPLATWEELRTLADRGWELGFHTVDHQNLIVQPAEVVAHEVSASRTAIECATGKPVRNFAYPYGEVNLAVASIVAAAGVRSAVTMANRFATSGAPRHILPRLAIVRDDSIFDFWLILMTGFGLKGFVTHALTLPWRILRSFRTRPG